MMPHIVRSVSHAPWNGAEIYVSQPANRLCDRSVAQCDAESAARGSNAATTQCGHTEFAGQRLNRRGALRWTRNYGAAVAFAEQQLVRSERCTVRGQINVEPEAKFLIRRTHRNLGERDRKAAMRAVVRRPEESTVGTRHEQGDEASLRIEVDARWLAADEVV